MSAFVRWLEARGEDIVTTREPGGTKIGTRIRETLLDPDSKNMDPRAEALLYAADRAQHVAEVIKPALDAGKIVVSDRFVDSSLAYQGLARGLGLDEVYRISEWATGGVMPDLVFYLQVDPEKGLDRVPTEKDRIEQEGGDFHSRVDRAYKDLADHFPERFFVVDAGASPDEVHKVVVAAYQDRAADRLAELDARSTGLTRPVPR
jgi:dTMP kinase